MQETKTSEATVQRVERVIRLVREKDWDGAQAFCKSQGKYILKIFKWAGKRYNVEIPDLIGKEDEQKNQELEITADQAEASINLDLLQKKLTELTNNQKQVYLVMTQQNQKLSEMLEAVMQLMDVVIPKYVKDIQRDNQVNTRIIVEALK